MDMITIEDAVFWSFYIAIFTTASLPWRYSDSSRVSFHRMPRTHQFDEWTRVILVWSVQFPSLVSNKIDCSIWRILFSKIAWYPLITQDFMVLELIKGYSQDRWIWMRWCKSVDSFDGKSTYIVMKCSKIKIVLKIGSYVVYDCEAFINCNHTYISRTHCWGFILKIAFDAVALLPKFGTSNLQHHVAAWKLWNLMTYILAADQLSSPLIFYYIPRIV